MIGRRVANRLCTRFILSNRSITSVAPSRFLSLIASSSSCSSCSWHSTNRRAYNLGRSFATIAEKVPALGDSISEGTIVTWQKNVGDWVNVDDVLLVIETDKVSVDIRATKSGVLNWQAGQKGDTIKVGAEYAKIDTDAPKPAAAAGSSPAKDAPKKEKEKEKSAQPTATSSAQPTQPTQAAPKESKADKPAPKPTTTTQATVPGSRVERRVAMSRMRSTIARRLKEAQNTYAMLTTFNEVDCSALMEMRNKFKDEFFEKHGVKLGLMSCFVKAAATSLIKMPEVNAVLDGTDIVYRDYVDISVAVGTSTGLVVPVLRNTESMSFAQIEQAIFNLGQKAKKNELTIEDMTGGTFTISNGGVYGSLMGTPIINPPQSAILGMHGIVKRPVVINDKIEIRPMMYVALTYDHRLLDGQQAVTFLRSIKSLVEEPQRLILDL